MMTNRPDLQLLLLLLLTASSSGSSQHTTNSGSTQELETAATSRTGPKSPSPEGPGVLHVTQNGEVTGQASETTASQGSKGNDPSRGTERDNTRHPASTESSGSSPPDPVRNSSSVPTASLGPSARTSFVSVPSNKTEQTTASLITQTMTTTEKRAIITKKTTTKKGHICSTEAPKREALVGRCLIAIALLSILATIFIMCTVVLATKLAGSRYRHKEGLLHGTEMVCISALMSDTEHPLPKPRHPKSNGALISGLQEDDGDDLTLNSFLPDTECVA